MQSKVHSHHTKHSVHAVKYGQSLRLSEVCPINRCYVYRLHLILVAFSAMMMNKFVYAIRNRFCDDASPWDFIQDVFRNCWREVYYFVCNFMMLSHAFLHFVQNILGFKEKSVLV